VLADKSVIQRLENHGAEVSTMTPDQLKSYVQQEQVKWKKVVQAAKLTAD
jgi:tripartite-type tricarboxylate transporter receptor subunit TctC